MKDWLSCTSRCAAGAWRCSGPPMALDANAACAASIQGLTLVHFSAQLEPLLTENTPYTPPNIP